MKNLFFSIVFVCFAMVSFGQKILKFPNGVNIKETIKNTTITSYKATDSSGKDIPVKVVNAKKSSNDNNMDRSLCGINCSFICYECGTSTSRELCCGCLCGMNTGKEIILEKVKGVKKVYKGDNLTIYSRKEGNKTTYIGLDAQNKVIALKIKSPKGTIVKPDDACWKCIKKGDITECEFFPCPKK